MVYYLARCNGINYVEAKMAQAKAFLTVTPVSLNVLQAVAGWETKRQEAGIAPSVLESHALLEKYSAELTDILYRTGEEFGEQIAAKIESNFYVSRLWLSEVAPQELKDFLRRTPSRFYIDVFRDWLHYFFGERLRVEGDTSYTGLYLEIQ